jgi:hypothetical protein
VFAAILIIVVVSAIAAAARELIDAALGGLSYGKMLGNVAAISIVTVGIFAALDQLQIAPAIVTGLFYALVATIAGIAVIAVGGGGISVMAERWRNVLDRYDAEKPNMQREMRGARDRIAERAQEAATAAGSTNGSGAASVTR